MASLLKTKKRTKPKIIEIEDVLNDNNERTTDRSTDQSADNNESERSRLLTDSHIISETDSPSAPPIDIIDNGPTGLANNEIRANFMAKVFGVLLAQKVSFTTMIVFFTYVPHLRKITRKWIFDPLFLTSPIGYPLFIVPLILMAIFPKIRRKLATWAFIILTLCLALMQSYALSFNTSKVAKSFIYSMGFTHFCDLGVIVGSKRKIDFTKWRYISLTPAIMIGSGALAPTILKYSLNSTIWPSIITTVGSTYLAANTRPVIRYNDKNLEPNEHVFAAIQLYLSLGWASRPLRHKLSEWFGNRETERRGYTSI